MKITIEYKADKTLEATASATVDGRTYSITFGIEEDYSVADVMGFAYDEISEMYLNDNSPLM